MIFDLFRAFVVYAPTSALLGIILGMYIEARVS